MNSSSDDLTDLALENARICVENGTGNTWPAAYLKDVQRLRAELARKDQAINEIRALVADAEARPFVAFGGVKSPGILDLGSLLRILSDLSEHQEGER